MITSQVANNNTIEVLEQIRLNLVSNVSIAQPSLRELRVDYTVAISQIQNPDLQQIFKKLATNWRKETGSSSSPLEKIVNENYLKIIKEGGKHKEIILAMILKELSRIPNYWFEALRIISNENPVKPEEFNSYQLVTEAWLNWGKQKGYL